MDNSKISSSTFIVENLEQYTRLLFYYLGSNT